MANRLQYETSPYLLQHAHNPVDWYPWGEEAFRRAREENKPVLLSIGYAACHWCHVMERESFEDEATAALMNELFINIKVDREERPDVDQVYMTAVQAMTGQGGWPLTVFLTPTGEPFYGGTYFPPEDRHGLPAFRRVLRAVAEAYHTRPGEIAAAAHQITAHLREAQQLNAPPEPLQHAILDQAIRAVLPTFDQVNGGFGGAPKFPQAMTLELLLRQAARTGEVSLRAMVELTLQRMAAGGIYDQLGGGFHRYAVDAAWQVPHFEKMLYDNALLARLYLAAWLFTGEASFRRVAEETLDYVLREMAAPGGGFCSSQDADSEGEEGKYYLWTLGEILDLLGPEDGRLFAAFYGVTAEGNFEGKNILHGTGTLEEVAARSGVTPEDLQAVLARGRQRLLAAREQRVKPGRDEKVLTSWNGMLLRALAEAAAALGREDYRTAAEETATFLLETLRPQGRLLRTFKDGRAHVLGYLEDYAHLIDGLLALYELTFAPCWLAEAEALADAMLDLFWDESLPGFYDTARDHEQLIVRPRDVFDNATPSGNSTAVDVLFRLGVMLGKPLYQQRALTVLRSFASILQRAPAAFARLLIALDFALGDPPEIAIVGDLAAPDTRALLAVVRERYLPNRVIALLRPGEPATTPLLAGKTPRDGRATAYVCRGYVCTAPVSDPVALAQQLGG
ncbi:MAG: thioredoxin domain-containing protein [Chloroflexi bacterium]|nr:thioredoxin domain-containing protein [Chloroflexota bacterium]